MKVNSLLFMHQYLLLLDIHYFVMPVQVIARLVDGSRFHEFKALYGRHLLTGFAHIQG